MVSQQELLKGVQQLRAKITEIEKYLREIGQLEKDLEMNAYQIDDRLKKIENRISYLLDDPGLRNNMAYLRQYLQEKREVIGPSKIRLRTYLGAELEREFKDQGWSLEGNLPELRLSLLTLEFLFEKGEVRIWYGPKIEPLGYSKLSLRELVNRIRQTFKDLEEKSFQEEGEFLGLLLQAYKNYISKGGQEFGTPIPIIDWLSEITWIKQDRRFFHDPKKEYFREYGRVQLSYDLYRLKTREYGPFELRLGIASREQTKKRGDNLWIPNNRRGEGTHFAYVSFKKRG